MMILTTTKGWTTKTFLMSTFNTFCIPESFNTNISHQLFDYIITFVISQHYDLNSKGDFVLKTGFKRSF